MLNQLFPAFRLALSVAAIVILAGSTSVGQKPNVVLFLVDDMGWADWQRDATFNPTGSDLYETPNMLRLAETGVVFNNAYSSSPVCTPTRAAIMTGKNPARTGITNWTPGGDFETSDLREPNDWVQNLDSNDITIAEALSSAGYNTGFFGKWHLGLSNNSVARDPLNHGFDVNVGGRHQGTPPDGGFFANGGGWANLPGISNGSGIPDGTFLTDVLSEAAADYIGQQSNQQDPFFAVMSHYAVHAPIQAPDSLLSKYNSKISQLQGQGVDLQGHTNAAYAGLVEKMDDSLGRILDRLDDPNGDGSTADSVRDNTLIIFASDNGGLEGPTDSRPLHEGKGSIYEGGIRTPFMVSWTGNSQLPNQSGSQGRVDEARTVSHDIYATILDAVDVLDDGITSQVAASERDGVSILPALTGQSFDRGYQYWHYPHRSNQDALSSQVAGGAFRSAVRKDDWKLVYSYDTESYELYNVATDLGETSDVLNANQQVAADLSQALRNYLQEVDAPLPINKSTDLEVPLPSVIVPQEPVGTFIVVPTGGTWTNGDIQGFSFDAISGADRGLVDGSAVEHLDPLPAVFPQHTSANGVNGGNTLPPGEDAVDIRDVAYRVFHGSESSPFVLEVEFDDTYDLTAMVLWNFAAKFNGEYTNARGIKNVDIYASTDGGLTFSASPVVSLTDIAAAAESLLTDGDLIPFGATITADTLRLEIINHGDGSFTGINELRFVGVESGLIGDYNDDDVVSAADYALWRDSVGGDSNALPNRAISLASAPIGAADYDVWANAYGLAGSASANARTVAVPEPCCSTLAAVVVILATPLWRVDTR